MGTETVMKHLLETLGHIQFMGDRPRPESRLPRRTGRDRHTVGTPETAAQAALRQRISLHVIGLAHQR